MHRRLDRRPDADGPDRTPRDPSLEQHVESCADCRELYDDLRAIGDALRAIDSPRLGDSDRSEILRRTVHAAPARGAAGRALFRVTAAAAVALLAAGALLIVGEPPSGRSVVDASPAGAEDAGVEDIEAAAEQVRLVLGLTSDAIGRSRDTVVRELFEDELRPALRRLPILGGTRADGEPPGSSS